MPDVSRKILQDLRSELAPFLPEKKHCQVVSRSAPMFLLLRRYIKTSSMNLLILILCSPMLVMVVECFSSPSKIALHLPSCLKHAPLPCRRRRHHHLFHKGDFYSTGYNSCLCVTMASSPLANENNDSDADIGDDLTKEELGLRLKEVRDYYRENDNSSEVSMSQETLCLSLFRTRFPDLRLNRCYVAESTISNAGSGLFATRCIEEGELITLYPGDAMLVWNNSVGDFAGGVGQMFGNHVKQEDRTVDRSTDSARQYELKIGDRHSLVADPLLVEDAAYLGHMTNDAAVLESREQESVDVYVNASREGHNAAHLELEGSHVVTVATKNIARGEEIFASYGYGYWFSRILCEKRTGSTRSGGGINGRSKGVREKRSKRTRSKKRGGGGTNKGFGIE